MGVVTLVPVTAPLVAALGAVGPPEVLSAAIASDETASSNAAATVAVVGLGIDISCGVWRARLACTPATITDRSVAKAGAETTQSGSAKFAASDALEMIR